MALFQSYNKITKWWNKKTAKRRKVDMKLRSGRKTLSDNLVIGEIEIPNKRSKRNKNIKHCERIVTLVQKKRKSNNVLNESPLLNKQRKNSRSDSSNSFLKNKKLQQCVWPMISKSNQTISDSNEITNQPSTSLYNPVDTSLASDSYNGRNQPSTSSHLPVTSTSNHSVISGSCGEGDQPSTSSHVPVTSTPNHSATSGLCEVGIQPSTSFRLPATSTPNQSVLNGVYEVREHPSLSLPVTSTPNEVTSKLSETSRSVSTKNLNSNNKCTGKSMYIGNSSKSNYYSLISDTSLTSLNINAVTTMFKNSSSSVKDGLLNMDVTDTRKSLKRKKCSVLQSIINQEPEEKDEERKSQKRKRSVSVKNVLSSVEECSDGRKEKDDLCSVISVPSDDDEIVVLDSATSNLKSEGQSTDSNIPPFKRQKTSSDVTIIDLCTPEHPSNQKKIKSKVKNNIFSQYLNTMKNFVKSSEVQPCLEESRSRILHPKNLIPRNQMPSRKSLKASRRALRKYMSILGTEAQRGPFPHSSSTITSSATNNEAAPGNIMNLLDVPPSSSRFGTNIYNPNPTEKIGLRPIVIDGSNVAFGHSNGAYFSSKGLMFCIDYFLKRNHKVLAFVPKFRKHDRATRDPQLLEELERKGLISFTPSRRIHGQLVVPYDDRYIVQYAAECGGIIVSTDNYYDLVRENLTWKETIEKRLLMFTWAGDILIFPQDPLGRYGPCLEEFLRFP